jgi:hypothetical protein
MAQVGLGNVAFEQGALEVAKAQYGRALAIQDRLRELLPWVQKHC